MTKKTFTETNSPTFTQLAKKELSNSQLRTNLRVATHTIRDKRKSVVQELSDWQQLRQTGREIKEHVMDNLDTYLIQLEASIQQAGGVVHWASDAKEANRIISSIIKSHNAKEVIKVKSITTDEIGLNEALAKEGIQAFETDLAELIVQLANETSSHILVPAIHKNRAEIRELFLKTLGQGSFSDDPKELAMAARSYLRKKFLNTKVGISGANFAVAQTGTVGVVESEGNGRMCLTLPQVLITVMGIEKTIPTFQDLEVLLQLLPRSSTAERMNPYTSLWTGVTKGDGPQEFHIVLLDNGRTKVLDDPIGKQTLNCIRCSACLNVCPVYERSGGHAYNSSYPGPIGAILTPQLAGIGHSKNSDSLTYASTLCGACYQVCPVEINIPNILIHLRGKIVENNTKSHRFSIHSAPERMAMEAMCWSFMESTRFETAQKLARNGNGVFSSSYLVNALPGISHWTNSRNLPSVPSETFRMWWKKHHG